MSEGCLFSQVAAEMPRHCDDLAWERNLAITHQTTIYERALSHQMHEELLFPSVL